MQPFITISTLKQSIELHVQVFLRMNTRMSETCRRHYNLNLNNILLVLITHPCECETFHRNPRGLPSVNDINLFTSLFNEAVNTSGYTALYGGLTEKNKLQKKLKATLFGLI